MSIAIICEKMGWTYQQYQNQPPFFIELLTEKMNLDGKRDKLNSK